MPTTAPQNIEYINVKQFVTDKRGRKLAAVIDMKELKRLEAILELIPESEAWLYKNRKALESVRKGLKQAAKGKVKKLDINEL